MPISDLIDQVSQICKRNGVQRLDLFGSFATGTATPTSDIDFVVYGCKDILHLEDELADIDTLRKIDNFEYESIKKCIEINPEFSSKGIKNVIRGINKTHKGYKFRWKDEDIV